jgi:hypothetical protein
MLEARAFILFAPCDAPKIARRPCIVPNRTVTLRARLTTLTSCLPSRCLHPRPSCDVRVHDRFGVQSVVRLTLSRQTGLVPLPLRSRPRAPGRVHLSRVCRARLSTTTGNTPSAHSPRAREFVSRFDESWRTTLFLLRIAPAPRTRPSRPPSPRGDDVCPAVGPAIRPRLSTFTSRNRQR